MAIRERLAQLLSQNQIMVVLVALVAGYLFPSVFRPIAPYGSALLMLIFFTSSLRLSWQEVVHYSKDWRMLSMAAVFMLVFLPVAMWLPARIFAPDWALPFLIMGAMPTGMTIALIAEYFGGKTTLALVITAVTSLLAPFSVPLVFQFVIGQSVPVPTLKLFTDLLLTIVLPFIVAMLVQHKAKKFVQAHDLLWKEIAIIAFGILIAGIVADTTQGSTILLGWNEIGIVVVTAVYLAGLSWLAYVMVWWRTAGERATIALCMVYMNNTLALFIANRYFPGQNTVPRLIIILLAINALLPFMRWLAGRAIKNARPIRKDRQSVIASGV